MDQAGQAKGGKEQEGRTKSEQKEAKDLPIQRAGRPEREANEPLDYQLAKLVPDHPWFQERGIRAETIEEFGLGYNTNPRGLTGGRIAIPIHNARGELVAYCGRAVTPEQEAEAKYKLPDEHHFKKSLEVYNLHRQASKLGQLWLKLNI